MLAGWERTSLAAEEGRKAIQVFRRERPNIAILDLRIPDVSGLDVRKELHALDPDSYFRQADLHLVDCRKARPIGASINAAKISVAYLPAELTASEIELPLLHGSRMRYRSEK